jgi:hypothetical protein
VPKLDQERPRPSWAGKADPAHTSVRPGRVRRPAR